MPDQDQFDQSGLGNVGDQAHNPAAPAGLQQTATAAKGVRGGDDNFAGSQLGSFANSEGYVAQSPSWFTGANFDGTNNGWDSTFTQRFIDGQDAAAADGTLATYFEQPDATGVVTWDHQSTDGRQSYHFGDVYQDGKKVANLYDMSDGGFDKDTANLMMSAWLFDGKQQARIFSDSDRMGALERAVSEVHEKNNTDIPKALQAQAFQTDVTERAQDFADGHVTEAIVDAGIAGGAVTGGLAGGAVGSIVPVVGTGAGALVGAAVGGIAGGVGAFLNQDELTEQAARAYEITAMSHEENGLGTAIGTGLQQWGQFSTQLTSPFTQLEHGLVELTGENKVGDHKSAYYALDQHGDATRPMWAKSLGLGATLFDSVLQFASPLNRAVYMTQMGGVVGGESAQLALTGTMFDPREGGFDNIFKDDKGNADPVSAAAGILNIGIDAVQTVGIYGLANQVRAGRAAVGAGEREVEAAGFKFTLDAAGNATGKRATIAFLAPSEQVAAISAARSARVAALKDGRAVTADDFYRAATNLATGSNRLKIALINGFGEGYEELAQGLLEPVALDGQLHGSDLFDAFLGGAAAGAGMSLGATAGSVTQDQRLSYQAYTLETLRRGGVEPTPEEWQSMWAEASDIQKRVMATRSAGDVQLTTQALNRLAEDQSATLVASTVDAAKAINARRTAVERDLANNVPKTDAYHVITGMLPTSEDFRPEAVEGSALTIARLLDDKLRGLGVQAQFLTERIDELTGVTEKADLVAESQALLDNVRLSAAIGAKINADVTQILDRIYNPNTDEAAAEGYVGALNNLLEQVFAGTASITPVEGFEQVQPWELQAAAAQFATLLHSREPKLDSGSYLALLPRASWELTRTRSDHMLQVNTDILQAINGDFDGDKIRNEYQLILSPERFAQARAGQLLGGPGAKVDIGVRNFDKGLTQALATSLVGEYGQLRDEATATLDAIETTISQRYSTLMSPAALSRVFAEFRTAVLAGEETARTTLLDALAREAGGPITDMGRGRLTNEWLWASRVVRTNFDTFQSSYVALRRRTDGPSITEPVADIDTPEGTNARKSAAVTDAETLALFGAGNNLFRKFQKIHYTSYNSSVLSSADIEPSDLFEMATFYAELARGVTASELARTQGNDAISARVLAMLGRLVDDAVSDPDLSRDLSPTTALSLLANVKVKDVWFANGAPVTNGQDLSLAQLLLKRALEADREEHKATFDTDEKLQAKHARLRSMTLPNEATNSVNAERAFLEVFNAVPFADSLGTITGALAPSTTPEQWMRNYISLDSVGRQQMERLFTNVPEYLDRKESTNIPYSLKEASRRSITPYRSMMDALLAVGRSELTFDPDTTMAKAGDAFGGRRADVSRSAAEDLLEAHALVAEALVDYRKISNRRSGKRGDNVALVQEMFEANEVFGRQVLEMIPDSAANAIAEFRDGQLHVAPWIYKMFTIENPREALFFYWKNLVIAQRNALQSTWRESDADAPGRHYDKIQSRFQRLLYQLAQEPGQLHYEQLVRKMDEIKDLDQFFLWLNKTPGFRGQQAPLLPFNDDVADFEADAGGGWVTARAGTDLRQAIAAVRRGAEQLRDTMSFRAEKEATDRVILDGIKRAMAGDPEATDLDRENLRKLTKAVDVAVALPKGFAPSAMLALTSGAATGVGAHSTDKGVTADIYKGFGELLAQLDVFGFVPGVERVMETLTAHSVGELSGNIADLARYSGSAMDAFGRPIEWERLSVEQAVELLDDSRTAPLGYALLTPKAMDLANGKLTERLLMDASLKEILDSSHYAELYRLDGDESLNRAMRYLSIIDAKARPAGAHFDVIRYVNSMVITRLSSLGRESTEEDRARFRNQAYLDTARALQSIGQVMSTPEMGGETLTELRKAAVALLRSRNQARRLPGFTEAETGTVVSEWVTKLLTDMEQEQATLLAEIEATVTDNAELLRRTTEVEAQYERNADRIRSVLEDDVTGAIVQRFRISGDPDSDRAARAQIADYAASMASFPARAPESAGLWSELVDARLDGRVPGDEFDWATLSRSVMGVYLADEVLRVATHVSIPPFGEGDPAETDARFYKYFDPAYTFLATDLLDESSPLVEAAAWLHSVAEQPRALLSVDQLTETMKRTVLNDHDLGGWTPAQMSQIVEAHNRMDSAGGGPSIGSPGNGPKRQAALALATRRTSEVPGPELLTTVALSGDHFAAETSRFDEVVVQPAGHVEPTTMPVGQLDNRFVAAIRVNGEAIAPEVDNVGYVWSGEDSPTGYRYVALERLRPKLERLARAQGVPLSQLAVELDFFHPDSRPAGPEWAHNVYFDGMSHSLLPDGSESLLATLWSDNGGLVSLYTQQLIDASKKGRRAVAPFARPSAAAMAAAEAKWSVDNDLAAMLRAKTELVLSYDEGTGTVDPSYYNAIYKTMALHHIVVGLRDGAPAAMTADEVIAHQAANGRGVPLPLDGARLVKLSPDVLRTMVGETGDQGVPRFFPDEYLLNPDLVSSYTGITEAMLTRFAAGWLSDPGNLGDTTLTNVGTQRVLRVRTMLTNAERNARDERRQFLDNQAGEIRARRYDKLKGTDARDGFLSVLKLASGLISAERNTFDFQAAGLPIGPRNVTEAAHTMRLLDSLKGLIEQDAFQRGWIVTDEGGPDYPGGLLTVESLDADRPLEHHIAKDDLVLVRLDVFQRPERNITQVEDRVESALKHLVNSGAKIALGPGAGGGDLRFFASTWLEEHGYTPVAGSRHLYEPLEFAFKTQNERAYESTLTETGVLRPARNIVTFLANDPIGTDENNGVLNPRSTKLRDRKALNNILPSSMYPNYNILLDDGRDQGLSARALSHLRTATDPANAEYRSHLLAMGGADPARRMTLAEALDRFHSKITSRASLTPEIGETLEVGDIIPFVHPDGRVVLYRHGFKAPRAQDLRALQDSPAGDALNIALAPSETEPAATANSGVITGIENRAGFGRTLTLETPLQAYGDKIQLEWNGMKYVVVPPTAALDAYLSVPVFANGTVVDLLSDTASADSKEASAGRVNNYRDALAFFQFDFTDDLVNFFYPDATTRPAGAEQLVYTLLSRLSAQSDLKISLPDASILSRAPIAIADLISQFATDQAAVAGGVPSEWSGRLTDAVDASTQIARAVVTYLLTPGSHVDNVLKSAGFSHQAASSDVVTTRQVPGLFADLLGAYGVDSPVHTELIRRFDAQLTRQGGGAGWKLHPSWVVEVFDGKGSSLEGFLQFGEAHSSGDNPILDEQASDPNERAGVSAHNAMAAALSLGATTAHRVLKKSQAFAKGFTQGNGVTKPGTTGESLWQMLTALPDEADAGVAGWRRETPAETLRRQAAREENVGFYVALDTAGWTDAQRSEYETEALGVLNRLNLFGSQVAMVDTWVRDHLGRPHSASPDGIDASVISGSDAVETVKMIRKNLSAGLLPHAGANLPLIDVNHLTTIYLANLNRDDGREWAPRISLEANAPLAASWDAWVETAFGTAWIMGKDSAEVVPEPQFHAMYLLAIDGRMHGYQGATTSTRYLPVSSDTLRQRQLMDPDTERMLVSISADENLLATDPTLFYSTQASLEEIVGGQRIYQPGRGGPDPSSAKGRQAARINRWHREVDAPRQAGTKMRGVRAEGQTFLGYTTSTSSFWRSMNLLRVGNAMFNVALAVSAPVEAWYRRTIDLAADVAVGESTGLIGKTQARLSERITDTKIGAVAAQFGLVPTATAAELEQLDQLVDALSTLPEFKAMVYRELMYQYPLMPGIGRVEKWLEAYARFGAKMQDPSWGMLPKDMARHYVKTVMRRIAADPTGENIYSVQRLLTELPRNPDWLKGQDLETHNMAIASISNIRSLKPSVLSLGFRGIVEPLAANPHFAVNSTGNLLKMLTAFQNFWSNSVINMAGLQGPADFAAFWFDGRKKSKLTRRMQALLRGEAFVPEADEAYDMSEVIEALDLGDSFIRGGITHTALFTLGMLAGNLGLSGEDDETKWRRRAAELQGAGFVQDPRQLANDFRNKDSLFLNWLPFGLDSFFRVDPNDPDSDSMAQMNWVTRYFLSPVIGFERFYETGDFNEVIHGFKDALGAHPVVNTQLWNEATETAAELHSQANDAAEAGDHQASGHLLVTAVGVLERMVLENSMVNMMYVGTDRYDRDPYVLPQLDSDGNPQVDVRGNPYKTNTALRQYVDDHGTADPADDTIAEGYVARDSAGATLRTFTENRFGLALLGSLFTGVTGGGFASSDMFRQNMPIKVRKVELQPTDQGDLKDSILRSFYDAGGQASLTEGEATQLVKKWYEDRDIYWDADTVEKQAKVYAAQSGLAALSEVDPKGREHLTPEGARAVIEGLRARAVGINDPSLSGVYMTLDQRNKIRDDISKDLVQEGVDLGFSTDQATWRMRRIMFGTGTTANTPKLIDLIYTDQIPWTDTLEYNQLNTTYVMGPNGFPMATGFTRDGLMGALGVKPLNRLWTPADTGLSTDSRSNTVDGVAGINTGLRALEPRGESWEIPSIEDITRQAADDIIDAIKGIDFSPSSPYAKSTGSGYGHYSHHGYGGGGGGYSSSGYVNFTRMYALPDGTYPYGNSVPFINTSNPIIRRADVRRERVWSERGRLKQWQ